MEKFTKIQGIAAPMPLVNIDTDMIIPKVFLKSIQPAPGSARTCSTRCAITATAPRSRISC